MLVDMEEFSPPEFSPMLRSSLDKTSKFATPGISRVLQRTGRPASSHHTWWEDESHKIREVCKKMGHLLPDNDNNKCVPAPPHHPNTPSAR